MALGELGSEAVDIFVDDAAVFSDAGRVSGHGCTVPTGESSHRSPPGPLGSLPTRLSPLWGSGALYSESLLGLASMVG